jgi:hypothetical protein
MSLTAPGGTGNPTLAPTPTPPTATGTVQGTVFEDTNNNGQQDPDNLRSDVVITDETGAIQTLTTDSNGEYKRDDVVITDETGAIQTLTTDSNGEYKRGTMFEDINNNGQQDPGNLLGDVVIMDETGAIQTLTTDSNGEYKRGTMFEDINNNGRHPGNLLGIPNVDVVITDETGAIQTLTTDSNGEYKTIVPAGSIRIDIDETTLPPGFVQTVGTNPTTVTVPAGSVATDLDIFRWRNRQPDALPCPNKRIELTLFRNKSSRPLNGYATIVPAGWKSTVFTSNPDSTTMLIPKLKSVLWGRQTITVRFVDGKGNPSVTLKPEDWHVTDCRTYIVRIFRTKKNKTLSCFNINFEGKKPKTCNSSKVPNKPFLEWQLAVYKA